MKTQEIVDVSFFGPTTKWERLRLQKLQKKPERRCANPACRQKLSIYNAGKFCAVCRQKLREEIGRRAAAAGALESPAERNQRFKQAAKHNAGINRHKI